MLKTRLTARGKGATVKAPNRPTEGSGPRAMLYPFLCVEYVGSCAGQLDKASLADPKSCPNIGDHLNGRDSQDAKDSGGCEKWLQRALGNFFRKCRRLQKR